MEGITEYADDQLSCEMCSTNARLYKCPRCSLFTCSLKCCQDHKAKFNCSGIRDRVEFVSTRNFKEANLKSDFHFLEDVLQTKERAKRTLAHNCGGAAEKKSAPMKKHKPAKSEDIPLILSATYQRLDSYSKGVKNLFQAAKERNTKLVLMPPGMTKRTLNKSSYNPKEGVIYWKVFVVFVTSEGFSTDALFRVDLESSKPTQKMSFAQEALIGISVDGVSENKAIADIFDQFMKPTVENAAHRHALRTLRLNRQNLRCLMHRIPSPTSNPKFLEVDLHKSLKEALSGQTIIEYPTIYFGTYEHTDRLPTLIGAAESDDMDITEDNHETTHQKISVLAGVSHNSHNNSANSCSISIEEGEVENSAMDVEALQLVSPNQLQQQQKRARVTFEEDSAAAPTETAASNATARLVGKGKGKVQMVSKDLLCLEYGSDEEGTPEKGVEDVVPIVVGKAPTAQAEGRININNVANIVGSMKQFIDTTLKDVCAPSGVVDADAGAPTHNLEGKKNSKPSNGDSDGDDDSGFDSDDGDGDGEVSVGKGKDGDAGFAEVIAGLESEGGNEEFLAALKDLADKDIESLKAIIAAAEMEEEEDQDDESNADDSEDDDES